MEISPGVYEDIPFGEYLKWDAVSKSGLSDFAKDGPGSFWLNRKKEKKPTKAMILGSAVDCLFFDGDDAFHDQYAVRPAEMKGTTNAGKAWAQEHSHQTILSWGDAANILGTVRAIIEYEPAKEFFLDARSQISMLWEDPCTGLKSKGRPDCKPNITGVMTDLKTTEDVSLPAFQKVAGNMKYHWQAAMYSDGWQLLTGEHIHTFSFVVASIVPPHRVEVYDLSEKDLRKGREQYQIEMGIFADCHRNNRWPVSTGKRQILELPSWA